VLIGDASLLLFLLGVGAEQMSVADASEVSFLDFSVRAPDASEPASIVGLFLLTWRGA